MNFKLTDRIESKILISFFIFSLPVFCFADGGGPILLLINGFAFSFGQVWLLSVEFFYLKYLLKPYSFSAGKIFGITFLMNLISTILGGILFPLIFSSCNNVLF